MKQVCMICIAAIAFMGCNDKANTATFGSKKVKLNTLSDSVSYFMGYSMGDQLNKQKLKEDVDLSIYQSAFNDGLEGNDALVDPQESRALFMKFMQQKQEETGKINLEKANEYYAEKEKEEGVMKTESGLLYKVIKEGSGNTPEETSKVKVHYHGTLTDGTVFDSSVDRGEPTTFGVNQVIKGWTEGLQLMKEGAKYEFYIKPELAYGERANGKIEANSFLNFEVELIEIIDESNTEQPAK